MSYTIKEHQHRFAAWAASTAASQIGCRFSVEDGKAILEVAGFNAKFGWDDLPAPDNNSIDKKHRNWRTKVINAANEKGFRFTDGVASKLINCYLKIRFVCGGFHANKRVKNLHPPIDSLLLANLVKEIPKEANKQEREWRKFKWTKLESKQYEVLIALIRKFLGNKPLWKIEEYWDGYQ